MLLASLCIVAVAYLLGSFPSGYLAGAATGIDIRSKGSGNIGATNVLRVMGKPWGIAVFAADALKGFAAVRLALVIAATLSTRAAYAEFYGILAAAACVVGHSFPVWLQFRGGKGVATAAGAIFGIVPIAAIAAFFVWLSVFMTTRYVSVASITAALALPAVVWLLIELHLTHAMVLLYFTVAMAALVVWRHRSNISRLLNGTEPRSARK